MENTEHIGNRLNQYFTQKRTRKVILAKKLNKNESNIRYYLKSPSMQTQTLLEICHALQHNFYQDIASELPASYTTSNNHIDPSVALIKELQQQITILKAEKEVLLQAFKK